VTGVSRSLDVRLNEACCAELAIPIHMDRPRIVNYVIRPKTACSRASGRAAKAFGAREPSEGLRLSALIKSRSAYFSEASNGFFPASL
jgi:hypothetical protein